MTAKISFFNNDNADTTLIQVNGKNILWDYASKQGEKHCDLPKELNSRNKNNHYDVTCFTHADEDHVKGSSEYFYFKHDEKLQKGDRKKINELWVPAAFLLGELTNDDAKIIYKEIIYRLKEATGVRIFSEPDKLTALFKKEGISYEKVEGLIVNAGKLVSGWRKETEGLEFFVHSPYAIHIDEKDRKMDVDPNEACIIVQVTFGNTAKTQLMLGADGKWEQWQGIVYMTEKKQRKERLGWDIFHVSHHSSYLSLAAERKDKKVVPVDEVARLFEQYGKPRSIIVSPSKVRPNEYETTDLPHQESVDYYESVAKKHNGKFEITMEYPSVKEPKPMDINVTDKGWEPNVSNPTSNIFVTTQSNPRVG